MAEKVHFELVSPERLLESGAFDMVVLPGAEGEFGVLAEHAPLVSLLRPGVITTYEGDRPTNRIFVAGGFAEVSAKGCIVLAETAEPLADIERAAAETALRDARDDLADNPTASDAERVRLEQAIAVAEARIEALGQGAAH